jgi:hypothetical protein
VLAGDAQGFVHDGLSDVLNVRLVLKPLAVAHVGAKPKKNRAARKCGIFVEEMTNKPQRGAPVRVAHLVEFVVHAYLSAARTKASIVLSTVVCWAGGRLSICFIRRSTRRLDFPECFFTFG